LKRGKELGKTAGESAGKREGESAGKHEGETAGKREGETTGQNESFEGYSGGWEIGSWYLIKVGSGAESGLKGKYAIPTRVGPMKVGRAYSLCGSSEICGESLPGR
jgi:hypothetical protein